MKKWLLILLIVPFYNFSQDMTNEKLHEIYSSVGESVQGTSGAWQFLVNEIPIMSLTDTNHNRMRIISPITDSNTLSDELIKAALVANFHTALDVKYAVSDGVLWSVFIHPLKELSEHQVRDAVNQVYYANVNFGTTFASTSLTFPGSLEKKNTEDKEEKKNKDPELKKS